MSSQHVEFIPPMEPIISDDIKESDEFLHQIKWDGIRGLVYLTSDSLTVYTKSGRDRTEFYPELEELRSIFNGVSCILDGEIIVLDESHRPSFSLVLFREKNRSISKLPYYINKYPIKYIIFDILAMDGTDVRSLSFIERQKILRDHITPCSTITIADSFPNGKDLLQLMQNKNFEGIVSKKKLGKYLSGKKHGEWYKTKIYKKMLVVIGGLKLKDKGVKSLLLGIYIEGSLHYIGKASIGLKGQDKSVLLEFDKGLGTIESSFVNLTSGNDTRWYKPVLTCWISFLEWTNNGFVRQPKIIGFSKENPQNAKGEEYTYYG